VEKKEQGKNQYPGTGGIGPTRGTEVTKTSNQEIRGPISDGGAASRPGIYLLRQQHSPSVANRGLAGKWQGHGTKRGEDCTTTRGVELRGGGHKQKGP